MVARTVVATIESYAYREAMRYVAALDGLRCVAALAVLIFHSWEWPLPGGYLGVDIFFAISGYLITATLLEDRKRHGRILLTSFYQRRLRRLVPALVVVLILTRILWPNRGPDYTAAARATLFYYANWKAVFDGPHSLGWLAHAWSLSIEEQFYFLWPSALIAILSLSQNRRSAAKLVMVIIAILVVAKLMGTAASSSLFASSSTFARMDELLLGSALALSAPGPAEHPSWLRRQASLTAFLTICVLLFFPNLHPHWLDYGGFTLVALMSAFIVRELTVVPGTTLSMLLGWRPLREIGKRSYGVYLFHYPIVNWVGGFRKAGAMNAYLACVLQIGLPLALAWLSYRFVEEPFLRKRPSPDL